MTHSTPRQKPAEYAALGSFTYLHAHLHPIAGGATLET